MIPECWSCGCRAADGPSLVRLPPMDGPITPGRAPLNEIWCVECALTRASDDAVLAAIRARRRRFPVPQRKGESHA